MSKANGKTKTLEEHEFYQKTLEVFSEGFKQYAHFMEMKVPPPYQYIKKVQLELFRIEHTLKSLRFCRVYIAEKHPNAAGFNTDQSSISTGDALRYHIENYFLRITTFKDQILHLYGTVHRLDIERNFAYERNLKRKANELGLLHLDNIIRSTNQMIMRIKPIRNKIAHEGYHHDTHLGMVDVGEQHINQEKNKDSLFTKEVWLKILKGTIMENIQEMMHNEEEMSTHLFWVLDKLYEPLNDQIDQLTQK